MTKKLVKHGNSAALVLDKPMLDLLAALEKVNKNHHKTLAKLAK